MDFLISLFICPPDIVSLKMIEDLKEQLENISQEVALLKEKQALQTGTRLTLPHDHMTQNCADL